MNLEKYVGIPFKNKGRDFSGCDCWGLVYLFYKEEFNIELPPYLDVGENYMDYEAIAPVFSNEKEALFYRVVPGTYGSIILFNIGSLPLHVGICISTDSMLHTLDHVNSCIEKYTISKWISRIEGFYAYKLASYRST